MGPPLDVGSGPSARSPAYWPFMSPLLSAPTHPSWWWGTLQVMTITRDPAWLKQASWGHESQ